MLLGDFRLTLMVVTCILATLVDLIGTLHFWDVTIDVIVCVNIVLVGACIYIIDSTTCNSCLGLWPLR